MSDAPMGTALEGGGYVRTLASGVFCVMST